jgi:hypothetical protein
MNPAIRVRIEFSDRVILSRLLGALALVALAGTCWAQSASTDRDNPTSLTTNEIRGAGISKDVQYYYTLLAGPGEVVLTTDARAISGSTFFEVEVFNMDAVSIEVIRYGPTRTPERKVKRFQVAQQQPVLLRVNLDPSAGEYMVRLGGAVQVETAATLSPTPIQQDAGASSSTQPAPTTDAVPTADPPAQSAVTTTDATAGKISKFGKLWMRIGAASELLGLSKIGKLKIDMKDGTSQEIGLLKVKKILAPKGGDPSAAEPGNEGWQRLWMKMGDAGEFMNLASTGAMQIELQDGTTQNFDLSKVKKVSLKK